MKLLLTNFHDGDGGGHTTYLMALARGLADRHEVHLAVPATSRLHREASGLDGVHVHAQPYPNGLGKLLQAWRAKRRLRALLRLHRFDVVHVNGSADHRLVLAALRGLPQRPKLVLTKHNSKPMQGVTHRLRAAKTDLAIGVSDATLRQLQASPYARCAPRSIRNGVDIAHYAPWPADRCAEAKRAWCGDDALLLGSNAGTALHKGWMDLVEALATLPEAQRARIHVVLCGKPPADEQVQRIAALGLASQVHFAGLLSDVRPVVAAFDVGFVLSYAVETISFACREMMAMAKPVLVSDYAGLPENIDAGADGWIVPVRDRDAIARALAGLLDARDRLPAMGAAARAKAECAFGLLGFVEATEAAYVSLLPPAGAPGPGKQPGH